MDTNRPKLLMVVSIFLILVLAACSPASPQRPTPTTLKLLVLPSPTPIRPAETRVMSTPLPAVPTSTPACVNGLSFVTDATIPDDTVVAAGAGLDKQWLVQNSGTCNWDGRYRLRLVSGDSMGAPVEQALFPARAGSEAVLRVVFTTPSEPGEYTSEWQAFDGSGTAFGDSFYIKIIVE